MKRSLLAFVLLACSAWAAPASAQGDCVTEATATPASDCVIATRAGVRGVWFQLQLADQLRREHLEVPELRLQVERFTQLEAVLTARMDQYREAAVLRREAAEGLERQLVESMEREAAARAEADAWWRQPALWFAAGAVVAVVVILAALGAS
jgi:TolA-binding protein